VFWPRSRASYQINLGTTTPAARISPDRPFKSLETKELKNCLGGPAPATPCLRHLLHGISCTFSRSRRGRGRSGQRWVLW
jgi:hypothetical protein